MFWMLVPWVRAYSATATPSRSRKICLPNQTPPSPGTARLLNRRTDAAIPKLRVLREKKIVSGPAGPTALTYESPYMYLYIYNYDSYIYILKTINFLSTK